MSFCTSTYGIGPTMSANGDPNSPIGRSNSRSPNEIAITASARFPRSFSVTNRSGGAQDRYATGDLFRCGSPSSRDRSAQPRRLLDRPQHHPARDHRADLVEAVLELSHDAEVSAATLQTPEQISVLVRARTHHAPVGRDYLRGDQVVRHETEHPLEPATAGAERETGDARRGDAPARRGEPVRLRGGVELAPGQAGLRAHDPRLRIDVDPLHRRQVEHDPVVADRVAVDAVTAALHGERQSGLAAREARPRRRRPHPRNARSAADGGRSSR